MLKTLADRLKHAMTGPPKVTSAALARACGIKPPSVSNWLSGKSTAMEGKNLVAAAKLLKVRADWLATGVGPMRDMSDFRVTESDLSGSLVSPLNLMARASYLVHNLPEQALPEAISYLEFLAKKHDAPGAVDLPFSKAA